MLPQSRRVFLYANQGLLSNIAITYSDKRDTTIRRGINKSKQVFCCNFIHLKILHIQYNSYPSTETKQKVVNKERRTEIQGQSHCMKF